MTRSPSDPGAWPGDVVVDENGRHGMIVAAMYFDPELGQMSDSIFRWRWYVMFGDSLQLLWSLKRYSLVTRPG